MVFIEFCGGGGETCDERFRVCERTNELCEQVKGRMRADHRNCSIAQHVIRINAVIISRARDTRHIDI